MPVNGQVNDDEITVFLHIFTCNAQELLIHKIAYTQALHGRKDYRVPDRATVGVYLWLQIATLLHITSGYYLVVVGIKGDVSAL